MEIQEKPKKEVKLEGYIGKLASTVRILEKGERVKIENVLIQYYPDYS